MKIQIKTRADVIKVQSALLDIVADLDKGKTYDCEIKKHREKRSKNANDYFHVLIHKIAEVMKIGNDECKKQMNLEYGTPLRLDDNKLFAFKVPKGANAENIIKYPKYIRTDLDNGKEVDIYIVYKETHTLDSKEMSRLLDGTIQEAQNLGIETITEKEKDSLLSLWQNS